MSAAHWRKAMNSGAGRARAGRARPRAAATRAGHRRRDGDVDRGSARAGCARLWRAPRRRAMSPSSLALVVYPFGRHAVLHLPDRRPVAGARHDRAVAHVPRRLRRHGLAGADDGRRHRRLHGRDLRHAARTGGDQPRLAVVVAVPIASRSPRCSPRCIGWLSVRTEGIYTIMITLAIGVAFYYLALQNYSDLQRLPGLQQVHPPVVLGVDWRSPVPFYYLALFWALAGYFVVKYLIARAVRHRAAGHPRQPAPHERAGLRRHRAPRRRVRARRPASPRSAACCSPGTTASSRRARSARRLHQHPDHRRARRHAPPDRRRSSAPSSSCCCRTSPSTSSTASASTS